jgi:hypothetical protein
MADDELFSVYAFFPDETSMLDLDHVDAETAVNAAKRLTESLGARMGTTRRVIIVDADDNTCFMWVFGKGVVFPERETA